MCWRVGRYGGGWSKGWTEAGIYQERINHQNSCTARFVHEILATRSVSVLLPPLSFRLAVSYFRLASGAAFPLTTISPPLSFSIMPLERQ